MKHSFEQCMACEIWTSYDKITNKSGEYCLLCAPCTMWNDVMLFQSFHLSSASICWKVLTHRLVCCPAGNIHHCPNEWIHSSTVFSCKFWRMMCSISSTEISYSKLFGQAKIFFFILLESMCTVKKYLGCCTSAKERAFIIATLQPVSIIATLQPLHTCSTSLGDESIEVAAACCV